VGTVGAGCYFLTYAFRRAANGKLEMEPQKSHRFTGLEHITGAGIVETLEESVKRRLR